MEFIFDNVTAGIATSPNNGTPPKQPNIALANTLLTVYHVLLILATIIAMFGMGTTISTHDIKTLFRRPLGVIVGLIGQCILTPALFYAYALILQMEDNLSLGLVILGCVPGYGLSCIFTFWTRGDIRLSMTVMLISTTLSLGFIPLNMVAYTQGFDQVIAPRDDPVYLPYVIITVTIAYMWISSLAGYFVGRKWHHAVTWITKICTITQVLLTIASEIVQGAVYSKAPSPQEFPWQGWFAALTLPIFGFLIGMLIATITCLGWPQKVAIGYQMALQNTYLALAIIDMRYELLPHVSFYSQFPFNSNLFQVVLGLASVIISWIYYGIRFRNKPCLQREQFDWGENYSEVVKGDMNRVSSVSSVGDDKPENGKISSDNHNSLGYSNGIFTTEDNARD